MTDQRIADAAAEIAEVYLLRPLGEVGRKLVEQILRKHFAREDDGHQTLQDAAIEQLKGDLGWIRKALETLTGVRLDHALAILQDRESHAAEITRLTARLRDYETPVPGDLVSALKSRTCGETECDQCSAERRSAGREIERLTAGVAELRSTLGECQSRLVLAGGEVGELRAALDKLRGEAIHVASVASAAIDELISGGNVCVKGLAYERDKLTAEVNELRAALQQKSARVNQMTLTLTEISKTAADWERFANSCSGLMSLCATISVKATQELERSNHNGP